MSQAVLRPNLTKKFQWEVSQIADKERSLAPLYRWFKCKLKPPKKGWKSISMLHVCAGVVQAGIHVDRINKPTPRVSNGRVSFPFNYPSRCNKRNIQKILPPALQIQNLSSIKMTKTSSCHIGNHLHMKLISIEIAKIMMRLCMT